ncbi:hypothetical protein EKO24_020985 [Candidatus Methylobacter oryzae]|uniref:Uncharacterized protein n=1 Tax=Candidatus Methylobacter oryzae TaxID=2497749 RepID=A0ABY3C4A8_9GAMM|nr:hypothetical protein EKO24_020985 [Candidatus Methylobacter oryzae]
MDNDTLINQARHLYAVLQVEQYTRPIENKTQFDRLNRLVVWAYCRYQRRLNRCIVCYENRPNDCNREFVGSERRFCPNCLSQQR